MKGWRAVAGLAVLLSWRALSAQVITPVELQDPKLQHLQQRNLQKLMVIGSRIEEHRFPYSFYLCRTLDVDLERMQAADQRSIRFDFYQHRTVLAITGNYYAAYSADLMDTDARLKETFRQVIVPILQAEATQFPDDSEFSAFAIEVSHHVRKKAMGVTAENPENIMVVMPIAAAQKFVSAGNDDDRQSAILEAEIFLNGEPRSLWLRDGAPPEDWVERNPPQAQLQTASLSGGAGAATTTGSSVSNNLLKPAPPRIISTESLALTQRHYQDEIDRVMKELEAQAHFVPYAPASFIGFRGGSYLQLSMNTTLNAEPSSSRYKLAALAFDDHVAHLIRPLLNYFPPDVEFDGVDFSTTIHTSSDSVVAVELFLPYRAMRCFASYDCSGQQVLDAGTVVINGERAELNLQIAEGKN